MSKSFSAKVVSDLLELFGMYTEENSERMIAGALSKGEKPTPPPKNLKTRFEDNQNGRVFYAKQRWQWIRSSVRSHRCKNDI